MKIYLIVFDKYLNIKINNINNEINFITPINSYFYLLSNYISSFSFIKIDIYI